MNKSLGAIEFRSIAKGIEVSNEMVKKAAVSISFIKSICPGKFLIIVNGQEDEVEEAVSHGLILGKGFIVDSFIINSVHDDIIMAFKNKYQSKAVEAICVVETSKVCAGLKALNKTLKFSDVKLVKLQMAFTIGGKLVYIVSGSLSSIEHGIEEGKKDISTKEIVNISIIPSPSKELIDNLIL